MTPSERTKLYALQKAQKRKEQKRTAFNKNKENYRRNSAQNKQLSDTVHAVRKRKARYEHIKEKERSKDFERKRKQRYREKKKEMGALHTADTNSIFPNRMSRYRARKRIENVLPQTPEKRNVLLRSFLDTSTDTPLSDKVLENVNTFIKRTKKKRTDEARHAIAVVAASVSGENIAESNSKVNIARRLGITPRRLSGGQRIRHSVLRTEKACLECMKRKTRTDALNSDDKKKIYDFWVSPGISRPTGNKSDIKRFRTGPKQYVSHQVQILEKTQSEAYEEFKKLNPDVKVGIRRFETLRPFFVQPVRQKDRETCCCRQHTEIKMVFKKYMEFRKQILNDTESNENAGVQVYEKLDGMINETLCETSDGEQHKLKCINRQCVLCGVKKT